MSGRMLSKQQKLFKFDHQREGITLFTSTPLLLLLQPIRPHRNLCNIQHLYVLFFIHVLYAIA
jgi:hypothetical protein